MCELGYRDKQRQADPKENPRGNHRVNQRNVDRKTMDVKQYHCRQRDMDDKAVERGRRILRKTAGLSQTIPSTKQRINNPMFTMACLASARGYGRIGAYLTMINRKR